MKTKDAEISVTEVRKKKQIMKKKNNKEKPNKLLWWHRSEFYKCKKNVYIYINIFTLICMYTVYTDIHVFIKPYFYKTVYITIMRLISYETMRNKEVLRDIRAQKKKKQ